MALHEYHDRYGSFPPVVIRDDNGRPIHSWRNLIDLADIVKTDDNFKSYDLSQPWDSTDNRLAETRHRFAAHRYRFLAIVGPHAAWTHSGTRCLKDFTDGTHQSALVIAIRHSGIGWSEPVDAQVTDRGLSVNGEPLDLTRDVFVLTADGSVRYALEGIPRDQLAALLTIDTGDEFRDW